MSETSTASSGGTTPSNDLNVVLKDELSKAEKDLKVSMAVAAILAAVVFGYMAWAYSNLKTMTDPAELATFTLGFAQERASSILTGVGETAEAQAPEVADSVYAALGDGAGKLREQLEGEIDSAESEFFQNVEVWLVEYFERLVKENPQLRLAANGQPETARVAFKDLNKIIRKDMEDMFSGAGFDGELKDATAMLQRIADRLEKYGSGASLSADEQEEKDLILAWFQLVGDQNVRAKDVQSITTKGGPLP
jgi:hypothetical protein